MGSANMSYQAFSGKQRENISFIDGEEAYDWYYSIYESLKADSTDEITEKAIMVADSENGMDELPETLVPRKVREWVIIDLDEAKNFFDVDFKMSFFDRIKRN